MLPVCINRFKYVCQILQLAQLVYAMLAYIAAFVRSYVFQTVAEYAARLILLEHYVRTLHEYFYRVLTLNVHDSAQFYWQNYTSQRVHWSDDTCIFHCFLLLCFCRAEIESTSCLRRSLGVVTANCTVKSKRILSENYQFT